MQDEWNRDSNIKDNGHRVDAVLWSSAFHVGVDAEVAQFAGLGATAGGGVDIAGGEIVGAGLGAALGSVLVEPQQDQFDSWINYVYTH